jgi:nitrogen regulatory protein PII-like uncharacterized protein
MDDVWHDLTAYEDAAIVVRLDEDEARNLTTILATVAKNDALKEQAVLLADKVASEYFEHFAGRFV